MENKEPILYIQKIIYTVAGLPNSEYETREIVLETEDEQLAKEIHEIIEEHVAEKLKDNGKEERSRV